MDLKPREIMEAGRELDALIAEKVMGYYKVESGEWWQGRDQIADSTWSPSTNIADAWQVVEKFSRVDLLLCSDSKWSAMFNGPHDISRADSAPHAICIAALRAKGIDV